jgi:hypothetical protein
MYASRSATRVVRSGTTGVGEFMATPLAETVSKRS